MATLGQAADHSQLIRRMTRSTLGTVFVACPHIRGSNWKLWAPIQAQYSRLQPVARMLAALSAVSLALTIVGCSSPSTQQDNASYDSAPAQPRPQTHRIYSALLAPQSAPDCKFMGPEPDTVDPDLWARLKLDYERHCYRQAEKLVRKRLRQLQTSAKCRIEPDRMPD